MTASIASLPVRRSVVVEASLDDAFATFTDDIDSWWPHRLLFAWLMTHAFGPEHDVRRASEVLVCFRPDGVARTRVDVEHRFFERHEGGPEPMRTHVDAPNGWTFVLSHFTDRAARRLGPEAERR